jgi:hypothetical protein
MRSVAIFSDDPAARDGACNDMTRLVLFKALEPIQRSPCAKEAGIAGDLRIYSGL